MEYKVNDLSSVKKQVTVTFPKSEVAEQFNNNYARVSHSTSFNGFRKGRVPRNVIRMKHGRAVMDEVKRFFLNFGIQDSAQKEELRVISEPDVRDVPTPREGSEFEFTYEVEVFPDIDVSVTEKEIEYTPVEYNENMLEEEMDAFVNRFTDYAEKAGAAETGDRVKISFSGKDENGEPVENTDGEDVTLVLGEGKFIEGFEKALMGKRKDESFAADVAFPDDYNAEDLAGRTLTFDMTVHAVETPGDVPDLTDEFLSEKDGYPDTVAEFREKMEEQIRSYIEKVNRDNKRYLTADRYVSEHDFELPPSFVEAERKTRLERWKKENKNEDVPEDVLEKLGKDAEWSAKRFIILSELARNLQITVSDEELDEELAGDARQYGIPVQQLKQYLDENRLNEKRIQLQESKVLDTMMEQVTFVEKNIEQEQTDDKTNDGNGEDENE